MEAWRTDSRFANVSSSTSMKGVVEKDAFGGIEMSALGWRGAALLLAVVLGAPAPFSPAAAQSPGAEAADGAGYAARLTVLPVEASALIETIFFAPGAAAASAEEREKLQRLAAALSDGTGRAFRVSLRGYADASGRQDSNLALSQARAETALAHLLETLGPAASRWLAATEAQGLGEGTGAGAADRRVEIHVTRVAGGDDIVLLEAAPSGPEQADAPAAKARLALADGEPAARLALADDRLGEAGGSLTLELWLSANWSDSAPPHRPRPVLTLGEVAADRLALLVAPGRDALILRRGAGDGSSGGEELRFAADLSDGRLHHLVLALTPAGVTAAFDGTPLGEPAPIGRARDGLTGLTLGAAAEGPGRFRGRIARLRFWALDPTPDDVAALKALSAAPAPQSPYFEAYLAGVVTQSGAARLDQPERIVRAASPWWTPLGGTKLAIANLAEVSAAGAAPELAAGSSRRKRGVEALDAIVARIEDRQRQGCGQGEACKTDAERLRIARGVVAASDAAADDPIIGDPTASYPLYKLVPVAGGPRDRLIAGSAQGESKRTRVDPDRQRLVGLEIWAERDVSGLRLYGARPEATPEALTLHGRDSFDFEEQDAGARVATVAFAPSEEVIALSGQLRGSRLSQLRIHTTQGLYGPFGSSDRGEDKAFFLRVPLGARLLGVETFGHFAGLRLLVESSAEDDGYALVLEDGRAVRFSRIGRNRFEAAGRRLPIPHGAGDWRGENLDGDDVTDQRALPPIPELRLISPTRLRISSLDRDFVARMPEPARETAGPPQSASAALARPVNIRASYAGYDITAMDPIHLTRTGVEGRIFRPAGERAAAYRAQDRILVPTHMIYTPLFTGSAYTHTTTARSLQEYKESFSQTVGVSLDGGKLPASFSASTTVERVRASFSGAESVRSLGLSRVLFYALSIDKARAELDPAFVADVRALAATGDYEAFIETYGTHYAASVYYGGLGVLELTYAKTAAGSSTRDTTSLSLAANAALSSATQSELGASYDQVLTVETSTLEEQSAKVDRFFWVGGNSGGASEVRWSVGVDGVVPVHVDLRAIDELLTPFFFEDEAITHRVRQELRRAIDRRLELEAALETLLSPQPRFRFRLELSSLYCIEDGGSVFDLAEGLELAIVEFDSAGRPLSSSGSDLTEAFTLALKDPAKARVFCDTRTGLNTGTSRANDLLDLLQTRSFDFLVPEHALTRGGFRMNGGFSEDHANPFRIIKGFRGQVEMRWSDVLCGRTAPASLAQGEGARDLCGFDLETTLPARPYRIEIASLWPSRYNESNLLSFTLAYLGRAP